MAKKSKKSGKKATPKKGNTPAKASEEPRRSKRNSGAQTPSIDTDVSYKFRETFFLEVKIRRPGDRDDNWPPPHYGPALVCPTTSDSIFKSRVKAFGLAFCSDEVIIMY